MSLKILPFVANRPIGVERHPDGCDDGDRYNKEHQEPDDLPPGLADHRDHLSECVHSSSHNYATNVAVLKVLKQFII
jgi:DNA primase